MSDDHGKLLDDLGDLEWDSALDEWEKNTFVPEVARDAETNKVAPPIDTSEEVGREKAPRPAAGIAAGATQGSLKDVSIEGTVIAPVPRELRGDHRSGAPASGPDVTRSPAPTSKPPFAAPLPPPPPRAAGPTASATTAPGTARMSGSGGLGQLFAKGSTPSRPPPPPSPSASPPLVSPPAPTRSSRSPSDKTQAALPVPGSGDTMNAETMERPALSRDLATTSPQSRPSARAPSVTRQIASPSMPPEAFLEGSFDANLPASDSQTIIAERAKLESMSDAETQTRFPDDAPQSIPHSHEIPVSHGTVHDLRVAPPMPADDDEPTFMRPSPSGAPSGASGSAMLAAEAAEPAEPAAEPAEPVVEHPVSRWLDEATATAFRQRASWLDEEARAIADDMERARALLGVSELFALVGDEAEALARATEARDLAPEVALAWRQTRQLTTQDSSGTHALVEALDAEAASSPTPAARAHATLMAADVLRTTGDGDAAVARWNSASKLDPADVRAPAARAALALASGSHSSAGTELAENSELIALDRAVATALKLRGAARAGTDVEGMPINDGLRRARTALLANDVVGAAQALADIAAEPALSKAALWLASSFGATHVAGRRSAAKSLKTLVTDGESLARRQLAARGIELSDPELVSFALTEDAPVEPSERAVLHALAGLDAAGTLDALSYNEDLTPLLDALSSLGIPADEDAAIARSRRAAGSEDHRASAALGRLLAARPSPSVIDTALAAVQAPRGPSAAGVALEVAVVTQRWDEVSAALSALPAGDDESAASQRHIAAALVSERAGNRADATRAWREALDNGANHDSIVRAVAALDSDTDLGAELLRIADVMPDGYGSAVLRLEGLSRRQGTEDTSPVDDQEARQASILERIHRGAPTLGIGAFLAERMGRRKGDVDEVLRWIQERRSYANDALEMALDSVREALLVADRDADLAGTRLEEAHRSRPDDVALRELYERLATDAPADRGAWREQRAMKSSGPTRTLLFTEAALEHERAGDHAAALRTAKLAHESGDQGLSRFVIERAEIETGALDRQRSELRALAKETEVDEIRRETWERLALLEQHGKKDRSAALAWHSMIIEDSPQREGRGESPRKKASLRFVEHTLIEKGRDASDEDLERVFEQITLALDGTSGGEVAGHAQLAARLKSRTEGGWERTLHMAQIAASQAEPSLWSLRALNAHARVQKDEDGALTTTLALLERTQRPSERSALLLRASEAAARLERVADARAFLEQAAQEDPGDVVTWGFLAEVRERTGETRAAAEACESLARTSIVPAHQVLAWFDSARIWLDEVKDTERGMTALEQCAEIDVAHADVFTRLTQLYSEKHLDAELARLLEKRLAIAEDEGERVGLEVELARALGDMGELAKAKASLENALAQRPDHPTALAAMAELCAKEGDWQGAEQAYVRLARLLTTPEEQRAIYEKLGEIYGTHTVNLSRAEVAYKEVLKRAPNDIATLEKLIEIYKRQGDVAKAVETQMLIVAEASDPVLRLQRLIDLAAIHETTARDARRAEQVLESARKEFPTSVVALRAMAEFYSRQRQMPAMQILLDRAAGDARRSFAAGRFVTSLFEVLHAAYELRGRKDAARVVAATLAAVEGPTGPGAGPGRGAGGSAVVELMGGEARAVDPRLDDVLAPEIIGPALRALLVRAGDTLDAVSPIDLRALRATPLVPGTPLGTTVGAVATVVGLGALQILVSPQLGRVAIPLGSNPPALLVGEGLMHVANERARAFVVVRALKMILTRSSSLLRGQPADVAVLVSALFTAFNPSFVPQGVDAKRVSDMSKRLVPALPRNLDPTVGVIALEAAGTLGNQSALLGAAAQAWANRVALLAIGDPSGALDGIAWAKGEEAAPTGPEERAAWIARNAEARELMTFSVTDPYSEARARLGLDANAR